MNIPVDPTRPQPTGMLSFHLGELADEVQPVDLSARVRATSRRLAVRRAVATSTAVVVAVAVVSGVAWAALPQLNGPDRRPPIAGESATPTTPPTPSTPPPSTPVSPSGTTRPSSGSGPASYLVPDRPLWDSIPATLYYLTFDGERHQVRALTGDTVRTVLSPPPPTCGLALSPDRKLVAWATPDGGVGIGDLVVSGIDGKGRRTVLRGVHCGGGSGPFWLPDSRHVLVTRGNSATRVLVDVETGAIQDTSLAEVSEYVAWSPTGRHVAYEQDGKIVVADQNGKVVRRIAHRDETPTGGFSVQGVSDDGRWVVVGMLNSDPDQIRSGFRLVDTVTGRDIALPAEVKPANEKWVQIYPLAGGQLLVRSRADTRHTLYLIGSDGAVRDSRAEPTPLNTATLLFAPSPS